MGAAQLAAEKIADALLAREIARVADRTPLDSERRQALGGTPLGDRFDRGVGSNVIALAGIAHRRSHRGEQQEEVEIVCAGQPVKRLSAGELGDQRAGEAFRIELGQQRIVHRHRRVDDAVQRTLLDPYRFEYCGQRALVAHVDRVGACVDPADCEGGQRCFPSRSCRPAPAEQCQVTGAVLDQPAGGCETEAVEPARDDIASFGTENQLGRDRQCFGQHRAGCEYDLADMAGRLHQPKRLLDIGVVDHTVRQRLQLAPGEQCGKLREQAARELRLFERQLIGIDPVVGHVVTERT